LTKIEQDDIIAFIMNERIRVLPPEVTVTVKDGSVLMTTVDKVERTEIARDLTDLETAVHARIGSKKIRRNIVGFLATGACIVAIGAPTVMAVEAPKGDLNAALPQIGIVDAVALAGEAIAISLLREYKVEIDRLGRQDSAILDTLRTESESKEKAAKAVAPSASK